MSSKTCPHAAAWIWRDAQAQRVMNRVEIRKLQTHDKRARLLAADPVRPDAVHLALRLPTAARGRHRGDERRERRHAAVE
jgi:hypothetical protein